jgi:hypothetical protein
MTQTPPFCVKANAHGQASYDQPKPQTRHPARSGCKAGSHDHDTVWKGQVMSTKIDQFCETMRVNLNGMEAQLEQAKSDIGKAQKDGAEAFDRKLAEAKSAVEGQRSEVEAAGIKVRHWVTAQTEAGEVMLKEWKDKLGQQWDRSKLELHADRAEASARSSVILAKAALADAKLATLEAIAARQHATVDAK